MSNSYKLKLKLGLLMTCLSFVGMAQQDIQFTQYFFNSLSVNPAYAGYKENWYLQATHRIQWHNLDGSPLTTQISADGILDDITKKTAIGLQITADKLGAQSTTSGYFNYSFRLPLDWNGSKRLCFGLAAGISQYGLDGSVLDPNYDDPALYDDQQYSYVPDFRFGVYYYTPKWYIGASLINLLSGTQSNTIFNWGLDLEENIPRKIHMYLISGFLANLSPEWKLRPGILFKTDFRGPECLDLNVMAIYENRFWFGLSYRTAIPELSMSMNLNNNNKLQKTNALSALVRFDLLSNLYVGYSYDIMINGMSGSQDGTHELTIGLLIQKKYQRILSPRFF
ncbi:MAG: type IX secretion system membrane protein PorP/SprF [Bacteroidales bacterium]|nr:type IX secretion system membrane protein PorP/SprF [Bacteroidales bacterium]